MANLKSFRKANKLTQDEVALYLGIARSFISLVETGRAKLPDDKMQLLLNNEKDWDVSSLLCENDNPANISASATNNSSANVTIAGSCIQDSEIKILMARIDSLESQLAEAKAEKDKYWDMIQKLMAK